MSEAGRTPPRAEPHKPTERSIACMEIWGGSRAFESSVRVPGNRVHVRCTPHQGSGSGGDIYYVSSCASGMISRVILADVAGHGEQVAGIARDLRRIMRKHINTADQSRFAVELNGAFVDLGLHGRFATAVLATYFAPTDHLILCNAGHPRPLVFRSGTGQWDFLDSKASGVLASRSKESKAIGITNLPLGVLDPTDYEQFALQLAPGDIVLLYTDALIEAADPAGIQLGEKGLLELVRELPVPEACNAADVVCQGVLRATGMSSLQDDATCIALEHTGEDPPRISLAGQIGRLARMLGLGAIDSQPNSVR